MRSPPRPCSASGSPPRCDRTRRSPGSSQARGPSASSPRRAASASTSGSSCRSTISPTSRPSRGRVLCGRTWRRRSSTRCSSTAPRSCSRIPAASPSDSLLASTSCGPSARPSRSRRPSRATASCPSRGRPLSSRARPAITAGAEPVLARSHHGSVSKEERALVEADLKAGRLRCVVATSSLELGIDMGAVDLVMQVESPPSVASGLQRIGRAGHQVGQVSQRRRLPEAPRRPPALHGRGRTHGRRCDRGHAGADEPARRARPADHRRLGRR